MGLLTKILVFETSIKGLPTQQVISLVFIISICAFFSDLRCCYQAWYQERGAGVQTVKGGVAGRSFYTSLGHLNETWMVGSLPYIIPF